MHAGEEAAVGARAAAEEAAAAAKAAREASAAAKAAEEARLAAKAAEEAQAAVREAAAARAALVAAEQIAADEAVVLGRKASDEASIIVAANALPRQKSEFLADLEKATEDAVKSAACDLVTDRLLPSERSRAKSGDDGVLASLTDLVQAVQRLLLTTWSGLEKAVNWIDWATSTQSAARRLADGISSGSVVAPSGPTSRVYLYYAKACLAPPVGSA
jgi:hypothetical protein